MEPAGETAWLGILVLLFASWKQDSELHRHVTVFLQTSVLLESDTGKTILENIVDIVQLR